jgi:hypothetical protein
VEQTRSRLNSLVEQPIGTVVLTIKPPGSSLEFEIKRAGRRFERPLSIVHDRDGKPVPPPHRLDGGSMAEMLQWEAGQAAYLSKLYRLVHRKDAPISLTTAITYPDAIPVGDGRCVHLIDYFSDPDVFGDEFAEMRRALRRGIASFAEEGRKESLGLTGEWGETLEFVHHAMPGQSILVGSTSFRLESMSRSLSADGVPLYLGAARHTPGEARRFADTLLDEALGHYHPPRVPYEAH